VYVVFGFFRVDDPELWRHIAIVKGDRLFDAFNPASLSLHDCKLCGPEGYFMKIRKCYAVFESASYVLRRDKKRREKGESKGAAPAPSAAAAAGEQ